jgi:hypothetical protein
VNFGLVELEVNALVCPNADGHTIAKGRAEPPMARYIQDCVAEGFVTNDAGYLQTLHAPAVVDQ